MQSKQANAHPILYRHILTMYLSTERVCDPPCEHGVCSANNECDCTGTGFTGDTCAGMLLYIFTCLFYNTAFSY